MDSGTVTAVIAAAATVLGTQGFLELVKLWGGRKAAEVDSDLKLSGGWQQLADRMSARVATLETEITRLQNEVMRLAEVNAKLTADVAQLQGENANLVARIEELEPHVALSAKVEAKHG